MNRQLGVDDVGCFIGVQTTAAGAGAATDVVAATPVIVEVAFGLVERGEMPRDIEVHVRRHATEGVHPVAIGTFPEGHVGAATICEEAGATIFPGLSLVEHLPPLEVSVGEVVAVDVNSLALADQESLDAEADILDHGAVAGGFAFVELAALAEHAVRLEDPGQLAKCRQIPREGVGAGGGVEHVLHVDQLVEGWVVHLSCGIGVLQQIPRETDVLVAVVGVDQRMGLAAETEPVEHALTDIHQDLSTGRPGGQAVDKVVVVEVAVWACVAVFRPIGHEAINGDRELRIVGDEIIPRDGGGRGLHEELDGHDGLLGQVGRKSFDARSKQFILVPSCQNVKVITIDKIAFMLYRYTVCLLL